MRSKVVQSGVAALPVRRVLVTWDWDILNRLLDTPYLSIAKFEIG
jgi:hypothetical protein